MGAGLRGPPGLGGDRRGLSKPLGSQSFLTGGGRGEETVAMETSPVGQSNKNLIYNTKFGATPEYRVRPSFCFAKLWSV